MIFVKHFVAALSIFYLSAFTTLAGDRAFPQPVMMILNALPDYIYLREPSPIKLCVAMGTFDSIEIPDKSPFEIIVPLKKVRRYNNCDYIYLDDKKLARQLLVEQKYKNSIIISNYKQFVDEGGAIAILNNEGVISLEINYGYFQDRGISLDPDLLDASQRVVR